MDEKILFCQACNRLIPPEIAERDDYAALGYTPMCIACMAPEARERLSSFRMTRVLRRQKEMDELTQAKPPELMYPKSPPAPRSITSTGIRTLREQILKELKEEEAVGAPAAAATPAPAPAPVVAAAPVPAPPMVAMHVRHEAPASRTWIYVAVIGLFAVSGLILAFATGPTLQRVAVEGVSTGTPKPDAPAVGGTRTVSSTLPHVGGTGGPLADIELILTLTGDEPDDNAAAGAVKRLRTIAEGVQEPGRGAAIAAAERYEKLMDTRARTKARAAAERAEELSAEEKFTEAADLLSKELAALGSNAPWARAQGRAAFERLLVDVGTRKAALLAERTEALAAAEKSGDLAGARKLAAQLRVHNDSEFQAAGAAALTRMDDSERARIVGLARKEEAGRTAWPAFFAAYDQALAAADFPKLGSLCTATPDSPLLAGGVDGPGAVLDGFATEAERVKSLLDAVPPAAAAWVNKTVDLSFEGRTLHGTLTGADGQDLVLLVEGKAEVRVPARKLAVETISMLLDLTREPARSKYGPALYALDAARSKQAAQAMPAAVRQTFLSRYAAINKVLPPHWQARFALEERLEREVQLAEGLRALKEKIGAGADAVRPILAGLRIVLSARPRQLSAEEEQLVAEAEKLCGSGAPHTVVFQNGNLPAPGYVGAQADQINKYYKNAERTVDTGAGLKLGSHDDIQRILIRFDGLEASLGKARVLKASLELYETEAATAQGAQVGVFRVLKPWMPGTGTWVNADQRKKVAWQRPGASGLDDAALLPESVAAFDAQKGLWRSWDVTQFVRDVIEGKAPNNGLLLRVVKDESKFHIRFYPPGDLSDKKDAALRPRLVVEAQ